MTHLPSEEDLDGGSVPLTHRTFPQYDATGLANANVMTDSEHVRPVGVQANDAKAGVLGSRGALMRRAFDVLIFPLQLQQI